MLLFHVVVPDDPWLARRSVPADAEPYSVLKLHSAIPPLMWRAR